MKVGAYPTILFNKCGSTNPIYEETHSLLRLAQSAGNTLKLQDLEKKYFSPQKTEKTEKTRKTPILGLILALTLALTLALRVASTPAMMLHLGMLIKMKMSLAIAPVASLK